HTRFSRDWSSDVCSSDLLGASGPADGAEVRAPHSGHWYALHWRPLAMEKGGVDVLTAVDISERLQALDTHKHQQEKLLFTSRLKIGRASCRERVHTSGGA